MMAELSATVWDIDVIHIPAGDDQVRHTHASVADAALAGLQCGLKRPESIGHGGHPYFGAGSRRSPWNRA